MAKPGRNIGDAERGGPDVIDARLALSLRAKPLYLRWKEIGGVLAQLDDRSVPYRETSVQAAVRRARAKSAKPCRRANAIGARQNGN